MLVSLTGIAEHRRASDRGRRGSASAAAPPHAAVAREAAAHYPALAALAAHIGDPAVRNRGTIGGSLANNDPSACYPAAALASGATIVTNTREIAADDYFQGMFTTALERRDHHRGALPDPRARQLPEVRPARLALRAGRRVRGEVRRGRPRGGDGGSKSGVFRWTEAEAALSADFAPGALKGLRPADGHDRRPARHAGISRASDGGADRARGRRRRLADQRPEEFRLRRVEAAGRQGVLDDGAGAGSPFLGGARVGEGGEHRVGDSRGAGAGRRDGPRRRRRIRDRAASERTARSRRSSPEHRPGQHERDGEITCAAERCNRRR